MPRPNTLEGHCYHCKIDTDFRYVGSYRRVSDMRIINYYACICGETYTDKQLEEREKHKDL